MSTQTSNTTLISSAQAALMKQRLKGAASRKRGAPSTPLESVSKQRAIPASVPQPGATVAPESTASTSHGTFTLEDYSAPQKYVIDAAMRSAGFDNNERDAVNLRAAFARAQARNIGVGPAAYTNNIIHQVESARAHAVDGVTLLDSTPYVDTSGAFATSYLTSMIECAPEALAIDSEPGSELASASEAVAYEYLCSFMCTARPGDFKCASGAACFGMRLFDEHGRSLTPTVWKVFFKPSELPDVLENPARFAKEAESRYCVGCKLELATNRYFTALAHNARMRPNVLGCDIHVLVDLPGEFPIVTTIGLGSNGYHGLLYNVPRITRVGWRIEPDSQCAGCYVYVWDLPRFPVPPAYYARDAAVPSF